MATPLESLAKALMLPELKIIRFKNNFELDCVKTSKHEVCIRCAKLCHAVYDHRWVSIRDVGFKDGAQPISLRIHKRRFWCPSCKKPFTEPVQGILPKRRTTQRLRSQIRDSCEKWTDLKSVCEHFEVSPYFAQKALYEQLELKSRMNNRYQWPTSIGIDEHGFGRVQVAPDSKKKKKEFCSLIVNHDRKKVMEVVLGKSQLALENALSYIPGRENVQWVSLDMCDSFRNFSRTFFPNAKLVADKFHVLRLLTPAIFKHRRAITGTNSDRKTRSLLLMSSKNLDYFERLDLKCYLAKYPTLAELYDWKEQLHSFYRIKGYQRARNSFEALVLAMSRSNLKEIKTLRKTLLKWNEEVLNYFLTGLTNARLEGFNCKASLLKRRAYGYKNPKHYRLRILSACG
jgi:transposase